MQKPGENMKEWKLLIVVLVAFGAGIGIGNYLYQSSLASYVANQTYEPVSIEGLTPIVPTINETTVHLTGGCLEISFDVTPDQAYSIAKGIEKSVASRPLTHDILKDILDNFGVEVLQIRIDRYLNSIYYATITLKQGNKLLELDARPSDSIALALRTGKTLYISANILDANGSNVC